MYRECNPNPTGRKVGDCTVRAISLLTEQEWYKTYIGLAVQGLMCGDMPSSNDVWGAYLTERGYKRTAIPDTCPNCYTVKDFCRDHPNGKYLLAMTSHVVAVIDGDEVPQFYWKEG